MSGEGKGRSNSILAAVGIDVAAAYGLFFALALFVGLTRPDGFIGISLTLADLLGGDLAQAVQGGTSVRGTLLVVLAAATVAVPVFWKHRLASLAYGVPLLAAVAGFRPLLDAHRAEQRSMEAMAELGESIGQLADAMESASGGPFDDLGIGGWLLIATVLYLAIRGVIRVLAGPGGPRVTSSSAS